MSVLVPQMARRAASRFEPFALILSVVAPVESAGR